MLRICNVCCVIGYLLLVCANIGCAAKSSGEKPTVNVKGRLTVNGNAPKPSVTIVCHLKNNETLNSNGLLPSAVTDEEGNFKIGSYKPGDGLPAGQYVLTFIQHDTKQMTRKRKPQDLLKKRYQNPKESKIEFSVEKSPVDLGILELTTK